MLGVINGTRALEKEIKSEAMKIEAFPGELRKEWVSGSRITKTGKVGHFRVMALVLTDEQRAWMCKWFPEEENSRLMQVSGMTHSTLHRFARQLGLTKSKTGMKRIKKRQAKQIKRKCESNGYYDSLRGKPVSEACRQGVSRMWQEVRDGKREHPIRTLKKKHPHVYKAKMRARGAALKELYRKDRMRVRWGLEPTTKLNILPDGFTHKRRKMAMHRYLFRQKNYIVEHGSNDIYYDEETNRSEVMEASAHLYGFRILPLNIEH